jgi:tight adherence protein C
MFGIDPQAVVAFVGVSSFVLLVGLLIGGRKSRLEERLRGLRNPAAEPAREDFLTEFTQSTLPKLGAALLPSDEEERSRLRGRLLQAGLYSRQALPIFLGIKLLLILGPPAIGLVAGLLDLVSIHIGLVSGALLGAFGVIGPSFWLDYRKACRKTALRRALPDALDVIVICLEGGLSLAGALRRVVAELQTAHTELSTELNIVQREIQLGRSPGEALRLFGQRCDLEEVRTLASVILQSERYGASLVKALRVHAETARVKRMQAAEERAQKAVIKILFPTVLCIMPALFVVILAPAVIRVMEVIGKLK